MTTESIGLPSRRRLLANLLLPLLALPIALGFEYWEDAKDQEMRRDLASRGIRATGVIERLEGKGENVAVFRFRTSDGREVQASYDLAGAPEREFIKAAEKIGVIYDPTAPMRAIPASLMRIPPLDIRQNIIKSSLIFAALYALAGFIGLIAYVYMHLFYKKM